MPAILVVAFLSVTWSPCDSSRCNLNLSHSLLQIFIEKWFCRINLLLFQGPDKLSLRNISSMVILSGYTEKIRTLLCTTSRCRVSHLLDYIYRPYELSHLSLRRRALKWTRSLSKIFLKKCFANYQNELYIYKCSKVPNIFECQISLNNLSNALINICNFNFLFVNRN